MFSITGPGTIKGFPKPVESYLSADPVHTGRKRKDFPQQLQFQPSECLQVGREMKLFYDKETRSIVENGQARHFLWQPQFSGASPDWTDQQFYVRIEK